MRKTDRVCARTRAPVSQGLPSWTTEQPQKSPESPRQADLHCAMRTVKAATVAAWEGQSHWGAPTSGPSPHLVQTLLQEAEENTNHIHVGSQELQGAFAWLQGKEDIQTLKGQVPQEVHRVPEDRRGGGLAESDPQHRYNP